jgi:hypothetical protein
LRKVDRYGVTKRGEQYSGWKQLSSGEEQMGLNEAAEFMAEHSGYDVESILNGGVKAAFAAAAKTLHPDHGGDPGLFRRLQRAREVLIG